VAPLGAPGDLVTSFYWPTMAAVRARHTNFLTWCWSTPGWSGACLGRSGNHGQRVLACTTAVKRSAEFIGRARQAGIMSRVTVKIRSAPQAGAGWSSRSSGRPGRDQAGPANAGPVSRRLRSSCQHRLPGGFTPFHEGAGREFPQSAGVFRLASVRSGRMMLWIRHRIVRYKVAFTKPEGRTGGRLVMED